MAPTPCGRDSSYVSRVENVISANGSGYSLAFSNLVPFLNGLSIRCQWRFALKLFIVFVIWLLSTTQAAAWPWDDPLDEVGDTSFILTCCVNKALHDHPFSESIFYEA